MCLISSHLISPLLRFILFSILFLLCFLHSFPLPISFLFLTDLPTSHHITSWPFFLFKSPSLPCNLTSHHILSYLITGIKAKAKLSEDAKTLAARSQRAQSSEETDRCYLLYVLYFHSQRITYITSRSYLPSSISSLSSELHWIKLNWIVSHWIELNWIELTSIEYFSFHQVCSIRAEDWWFPRTQRVR